MTRDCYKCKGTEFETMPFINAEFTGTKFKCTACGHEMIKFRPKCPERQRQLNEGCQALKKQLQDEEST